MARQANKIDKKTSNIRILSFKQFLSTVSGDKIGTSNCGIICIKCVIIKGIIVNVEKQNSHSIRAAVLFF